MKKKLKLIKWLSLLLVFFAFVAYLLLAHYYSKGFSLNTWINGVYCTGKSVEEVDAELLSQIEAPIVTVTDKDGNKYELDLSEMNYQVDFHEALNGFLQEQNPYLWIDNLTFHRRHEVVPEVSYDEEKLRQVFLEEIPFVTHEVSREEDYRLTYSEAEGYQLYDGLSHRYDAQKAFEQLVLAIGQGETGFSLERPEFYYDITLSEAQKQTKALWEKLEYFYQCDIVYDMGTEQIPLTPQLLSDFLVTENDLPYLDKTDSLVLNEEAVTAFVTDLAKQYDTYGKERSFQSTRGDVVTVKGGTYGTLLNQKKETAFLMENLLAKEMHTGTEQKHIPVYEREAYVRGLNDIGDTYIEVDMTEQKLYLYIDGAMEIETDIVTGDMRRGMSTPEGINYVYNKQTDRILRGEGYASPVDYWMPVKGAIGIHDANWRSKFGGEIYKTDGSHGCINVPPEVMPDIYEVVEIGTPVIMFY